MRILPFHNKTRDDEWITGLFREYYAAMCVLANRIVNDRQTAEDIVQECFAKLWTKRADLPDIGNIQAYLYTTVRNKAYNYKRDNEPTTSIEDDNEEPGDALHDIIEAETMKQLYEAINSLPPKCKQIFNLSLVHGKQNHEIAERMQVAESTVRNQKARGIAILKKLLLPRQV